MCRSSLGLSKEALELGVLLLSFTSQADVPCNRGEAVIEIVGESTGEKPKAQATGC